MRTYQKLKIEVLELQEDVITTSNGEGSDNIIAGNSGWSGWSEGVMEK